jgi:hypothetical protein
MRQSAFPGFFFHAHSTHGRIWTDHPRRLKSLVRSLAKAQQF